MLSRIYRIALGTIFLCFPLHARADTRPASTGLYAQVGVGAKPFLAENQRYAAPGPRFSLHIGTDVFSWFSVGGRVSASSHEATVPAPPVGEYLQFYEAAGEARLSISIGRVAIYAEGILGISAMSTNILEKVALVEPGQRISPIFGGGGGIEYQLQNRHYALGVGGNWTVYPTFATLQTAEVFAYLRYTY